MKFIPAALVLLMMFSPAAALEYPCPTDPGFCYRDVGDDGCFDLGVDEGPINVGIEASANFPLVPPPGSLICPPSVKQLTATASDIRLATPVGSSVLFYSARVNGVHFFEVMSGEDILLGERVTGLRSTILDASGDIAVEKGVDLKGALTNSLVSLESTSGDITIGPKARFRAAAVFAEAISGNVVLLEKVKMTAKHSPTTPAAVSLVASGDVTMENATFIIDGSSVEFKAEGANVFVVRKSKLRMKGKFSPTRADIIASSGDLIIDRITLKTDAPITFSGTNVTIGVENNGKTPRSKITQIREGVTVDILATGDIDIDNLALVSASDVLIDTSGTMLNFLDGLLKGKKVVPTVTVSAGAGSTCDLTGTTVKNATLVTACDTVIGP